jgi:hypothetical protein
MSNDAENKRGKPDNSRQERKGLRCVPSAALVGTSEADATPVPDAPTVDIVVPVDENTECCLRKRLEAEGHHGWCTYKPRRGEEEIATVASNARFGRNHPDE